MEPDVIRLYSSSPPPMDDAEDEDEFGDFGAFSSVSVSFGEPDASGHASSAPDATSPPELLNGPPAMPGTRHEAKASGAAPCSRPPLVRSRDRSGVKRPDSHVAGGDSGEIVTNGFADSDVKSGPHTLVSCHAGDNPAGDLDGLEAEFADFAAFSGTGQQLGATCGPGHGDGVRQEYGTARTGPDCEATPPPALCDTQPGAKPSGADFAHDAGQADGGARCHEVNGVRPQGINGLCVDLDAVRGDGVMVNGSSVDGTDSDVEVGDGAPPPVANGHGPPSDGQTSSGRPLSTDATEEYGDVSATSSVPSPPPLQEEMATPAEHSQLDKEEEEFGDFGDAAGLLGEQASKHQEACPRQARDDFGDFSDADAGGGASLGHFAAADARWNAFGEEPHDESTAGQSWAAFSSEDASVEAWHRAQTSTLEQDSSRQTEALWSRVEKLLEASFPRAASPAAEERVSSLKTLVAAHEDGGGVWSQLRDVHQAVGLRHQWGGSHCNKTLLGCLGIDTRNILFTGQKKQPLIVPVYAASLGMLEPTKEPVKPVSAAEMIASIARAPAAAPDGNSDVVQEVLPPVQFDWSSSGLTNPLDASGGSFLLNLDFFGPVDDSGSSCSPAIPGMDPELVELTTAKMDLGGAGGRVVDAFARLMSTMDKTSTSTRRTRKDEKLSSEAAEVICGLPDLSFMTAKVLMFPATLMPLATQATPD